jgi:hypothetical protein
MASRQSEALQAYNASAWGGIAITASDSTVLSPVLRALYVGGAGNVAVRMLDGSTQTFVGVAAGTVLPIQIDKVMATNTTASSMVGLY